MEPKEILAAMDKILDSKLEPIRNDISYIKTEIHALRTHTESMVNRLAKIEERMANSEVKLDTIIRKNDLVHV